jgi:hypothetical protein
MSLTTWESYEDVSRYLIAEFKDHFDLNGVEGKQRIKGRRSETLWEVDAKGTKTGSGEVFVIIECRRHTTSPQKQEELGALAYRIMDTGASGGIIVSPLPLQEGAKKVAEAEGIVEMTLTQDSTPTDFVMSFLNKIFVRTGDKISMTGAVIAVVVRKNGSKSDHTAR